MNGHRHATLIADIGGTHARFAVARDGRISGDVTVMLCRDFADLAAAATVYLAGLTERPRHAVMAVAAPVNGDRVHLTNLAWAFSTEALRQDLSLDTLDIINDFTAIAWAVPRLSETDYAQLGGGAPCAGAPVAILGPGSGLGVAGLIPTRNGGWTVLPTEAGHVTLAASNAVEDRVLDTLRLTFGHVSAERVLSGPGLINIFTALAALDGEKAEALSPEAISAQALADPASRPGQALGLFCDFLGTAASNTALSLDARGGVYLAGGIISKWGDAFARSGFRQRFEAKGRYAGYLAAIPTYAITHPYPALAGMACGGGLAFL